tara:strand:- start:4191 stop:4373 length:183 start_codon:yes stop_codon:yes gene_type:complete
MIDAVWHQKEYDIPIKVIAYLGYKDGQNWWLVENEYGRTGIPESEIKLRGRNYERQRLGR